MLSIVHFQPKSHNTNTFQDLRPQQKISLADAQNKNVSYFLEPSFEINFAQQ